MYRPRGSSVKERLKSRRPWRIASEGAKRSRRRLLQIRRKHCKKREARRRAVVVPVSDRPGQTGSETYVMVPDATWLTER